ncbi:MAG: hypothetical protein AB7N65_03150 [Vicinamibacterales bacterium]
MNLYRARATITHGPLCEAADLIRAVRQTGYGASLTAELRGGDSGAGHEQDQH